jgi:hypothetical protein
MAAYTTPSDVLIMLGSSAEVWAHKAYERKTKHIFNITYTWTSAVSFGRFIPGETVEYTL